MFFFLIRRYRFNGAERNPIAHKVNNVILKIPCKWAVKNNSAETR